MQSVGNLVQSKFRTSSYLLAGLLAYLQIMGTIASHVIQTTRTALQFYVTMDVFVLQEISRLTITFTQANHRVLT